MGPRADYPNIFNHMVIQNIVPEVPDVQMLRQRARRALFAPVDHDHFQATLAQAMSELLRAGSERWNFDFEAGVPLEGNYNWELVSSSGDLSTATSASIVHLGSSVSGLSAATEDLSLSSPSTSQAEIPPASSPAKETTPAKLSKPKQTTILDFTTSRKQALPRKNSTEKRKTMDQNECTLQCKKGKSVTHLDGKK